MNRGFDLIGVPSTGKLRMATIELGPWSKNLDTEEIAVIDKALSDADIGVDIDEDADGRLLDGDVDDDLFADFLDRLDANGAACDIYVPVEFEDVIEASGYTIGSAQALLMVLEELKDDIFGDEEDADEDEEDDDDGDFADFADDDDDDDDDDGPRYGPGSQAEMHLQDEQLRHLWKTLQKGARTAVSDKVCLFVHR